MIISDGTGTATVDLFRFTSDTALDIIGSAVLGHDFDALGNETAYAKAIEDFQYVAVYHWHPFLVYKLIASCITDPLSAIFS